MRELGLTTRHDFIGMIHCLSLTDTFWMKREDEALTWDDVSLYRNPFDDVIARIAFDGTGMYGRQNSPTSRSSRRRVRLQNVGFAKTDDLTF